MTDNTLVVSEVFGPVFQGEGPSTGQRAAFIRLGGCNLHCRWCDTPYTWDAGRYDLRAEMQREPVDVIVEKVLAWEPQLLVISGGEPLLHQRQPGWVQLLNLLRGVDLPIEVETNGTIPPTPLTAARVAQFNVSPKLAHSGDSEEDRIRIDVLRCFSTLSRLGSAVLKVVCQTSGDVVRAKELALRVDWKPEQVWVMPEGQTGTELADRHRIIAEAALAHGVNFTTRLHILVWGTERGR